MGTVHRERVRIFSQFFHTSVMSYGLEYKYVFFLDFFISLETHLRARSRTKISGFNYHRSVKLYTFHIHKHFTNFTLKPVEL